MECTKEDQAITLAAIRQLQSRLSAACFKSGGADFE